MLTVDNFVKSKMYLKIKNPLYSVNNNFYFSSLFFIMSSLFSWTLCTYIFFVLFWVFLEADTKMELDLQEIYRGQCLYQKRGESQKGPGESSDQEAGLSQVKESK